MISDFSAIKLPRNGELSKSKFQDDINYYCNRFNINYIRSSDKAFYMIPQILISLKGNIEESSNLLEVIFTIEFGVKGQSPLFKSIRKYKWDYFYHWMHRLEFELLQDICYTLFKYPSDLYDEGKLLDLNTYCIQGISDAAMRNI